MGAVTSRRYTSYDSTGLGLPQEIDEYDFTSTTWGNPIKKTLISYASNLGYIVDRPSSVVVKDGSNNLLAQTTYNYDEDSQYPVVSTSGYSPGVPQHVPPPGIKRANLTTVTQCVSFSGSTCAAFLSKHFTYYDTGTPSTAIDVNGAVTTYNYPASDTGYSLACGYAFPTKVTPPTGASGVDLSTTTTWNCPSGAVATSTTDPNSQATSVTFGDPNFWRPTSVSEPFRDGGGQNVSTISYTPYSASPLTLAATESTMNFNGTTSTVDTRTTLDLLGRTHIVQRKQSPTATNYDSVETDYDSYGRPWRTSMPYVAVAGGAFPTGTPVSTTTYDALSRPLHVADGGNPAGTVDYSYSGNDVLVTVGPAPGGADGLKQRQYEYDGLGRLTSVCELITVTGIGRGTCGQSSPQTSQRPIPKREQSTIRTIPT